MGNMSYCRFHNTLLDLRDCSDAIHHSGQTADELSTDERKSWESMKTLMAEMLIEEGYTVEEPKS